VKTLAISVFKAHALEAIGRVASTREGLVITKRGKPVARVVPYQPDAAAPVPGTLADALVFEKDIVTPLGKGIWESAR
jgi:prevent-host-death family protein